MGQLIIKYKKKLNKKKHNHSIRSNPKLNEISK